MALLPDPTSRIEVGPVIRVPRQNQSEGSPKLKREFLYLFERLNEPLYLGTRGNGTCYYDVPIDHLKDKSIKAACDAIKRKIPPSIWYKINYPKNMPDLQQFADVCPRNENFYSFVPAHYAAFVKLKNIFIAAEHISDFLDMSAVTRDHPHINTRLWLRAMASAMIEKKEFKGFPLPNVWEIVPNLFMSPGAKIQTMEQALRPAGSRAVVVATNYPGTNGRSPQSTRLEIGPGFTGTLKNMEQRLWYFREDIGYANFHWHWHIIYVRDQPKELRDRKGELFYYMHHDLLIRYEANRMANGLNRVKPLDVTIGPVLEEGYFSKLTGQNSSRPYGPRQDFTKLMDVNRQDFGFPGTIFLEDLRKIKDRLNEAIDTNVAIDSAGNRVRLTEPEGIDILGGLVEDGGRFGSINQEFYGSLHNRGHLVISVAHDPQYFHKEPPGVMGETLTSVRDPSFYRWHKFIDDLFTSYKATLPRYRREELLWDRVKITNVEVKTKFMDANRLVSSWAQNDIDVTRGLDFTRPVEEGPLWVRLTRLDNEPFFYNIDVNLSGTTPASGIVRIFMAPRFDEYGKRLVYEEQRRLFFEMDKFSFMFQPGTNQLARSSLSSAVTIPLEQSFRDIELALTQEDNPASAVCGCGWPQNLLFPKGTPNGMSYDLFVMVTDGSKDVVPPQSPVNSNGCVEAISYCGSLDQKYPDKKPMGYPFDKRGPEVKSTEENANDPGPETLEELVSLFDNMKAIQLKIIHKNIIKPPTKGAPRDASIVEVPYDEWFGTMVGNPARRNRGRGTGEDEREDQPLGERDFSPDRFESIGD